MLVRSAGSLWGWEVGPSSRLADGGGIREGVVAPGQRNPDPGRRRDLCAGVGIWCCPGGPLSGLGLGLEGSAGVASGGQGAVGGDGGQVPAHGFGGDAGVTADGLLGESEDAVACGLGLSFAYALLQVSELGVAALALSVGRVVVGRWGGADVGPGPLGDGTGDGVGLGGREPGSVPDGAAGVSGQAGDGLEEGWVGIVLPVVAPQGVGLVSDVVEGGVVAMAGVDVVEGQVCGAVRVVVDVLGFWTGLPRGAAASEQGHGADGTWGREGEAAFVVEGVGQAGHGVVPEDHVGVMADDLAGAVLCAGAGNGLEAEVSGPCRAVRIGAAVSLGLAGAGRGVPGVESSWGEGAGDEARGMAGEQGDGVSLVDV